MSANARNTDKQTSHDAAAYMADSGIQMKMIDKVVGMVAIYPDHTGKEIADHFGYADTSQITKRISDAERKGLIEAYDARTCAITNRKASIYRLAVVNPKTKPATFYVVNDEVMDNCFNAIRDMAGEGDCIVSIKTGKEKRSEAQHRLKWLWMGHLEKTLSGEGEGWDRKRWNDFFKKKFMKEILIAQDEDYASVFKRISMLIQEATDKRLVERLALNVLKTEDFTVKSMSDYLDCVDKYCVTKLKVTLPVPEDLKYLRK